jgi:hypothetical protein
MFVCSFILVIRDRKEMEKSGDGGVLEKWRKKWNKRNISAEAGPFGPWLQHDKQKKDECPRRVTSWKLFLDTLE